MSSTKTFQFWKTLDQEAIKARVFAALEENVNYADQGTLGVPASALDSKVFSQDESFIKEAPYISVLVQNPNHIGCHTLGKSESYFNGTQAIERELIEICAVDILGGDPGQHDGYVAAGGTEANMQAIWIYRNYYMRSEAAKREEIAIICSEDSHYSMDKAADVFALDLYKAKVEPDTREVTSESLALTLAEAEHDGKKFLIVVANMMTTMYGSVDDVQRYVNVLQVDGRPFELHVDGAFGGFFYPFTEGSEAMSFRDPHISSFTLDAHKMAQAPYGTGLFLIRKGMMQYATTQAATYVEGEDRTLIGSRSGANAIAVWMILSKHGPYGWHEKIFVLQKRADWIEERLQTMNLTYFRHPGSNIIAIRAEHLNPDLVKKYGLVPDDHEAPRWYKIVVMEHVTIEKVILLIEQLKEINSST